MQYFQQLILYNELQELLLDDELEESCLPKDQVYVANTNFPMSEVTV